jgi:hypothetical protein
MKKLSIAIIAAFLLCFSLWLSAQGGPGISSPGGGGSGSGDMTKAVYDTDADSKVDALDITAGAQSFVDSAVTPVFINKVGRVSAVSNFLLSSVTAPYVNSLTSSAQAQIDGKQASDADLGTWSTISPASSVTSFLSGATAAYAYGMPNMQSGSSSYVLTSIGANKIPIWTNAPAGGTGSGTVNTSSAVGLAYYPAIGSAVTDFKSGTSGALLMSGGSGATPVWATDLNNISLNTTQGWEKNRVVVFDASGILSGATNIEYSGTSRALDLSGVTLVIQSGVSPTQSPCKSGTMYWDTDDLVLRMCTNGSWTTGSGVTLALNETVTTKPGRLTLDTTADQLITGGTGSGATEIVVGGVTEFMSLTISGVTDVGDADDHFIVAGLPYNITLKEITAVQRRNRGGVGGTPTTINIQSCSAALSCTDMLTSDWILSGSTTQVVKKSVGDFSNSIATKYTPIKLDVVSGATNSDLTVTIVYWINRE